MLPNRLLPSFWSGEASNRMQTLIGGAVTSEAAAEPPEAVVDNAPAGEILSQIGWKDQSSFFQSRQLAELKRTIHPRPALGYVACVSPLGWLSLYLWSGNHCQRDRNEKNLNNVFIKKSRNRSTAVIIFIGPWKVFWAPPTHYPFGMKTRACKKSGINSWQLVLVLKGKPMGSRHSCIEPLNNECLGKLTPFPPC